MATSPSPAAASLGADTGSINTTNTDVSQSSVPNERSPTCGAVVARCVHQEFAGELLSGVSLQIETPSAYLYVTATTLVDDARH
jgi:hypothetical protein